MNIVKLKAKAKDSAFERLPEEVRRKAVKKRREEEEAIETFLIKQKTQNLKFTIIGAVVYLILGNAIVAFTEVQSALIYCFLSTILGAISGFSISKWDLNTLIASLVFGLPMMVISGTWLLFGNLSSASALTVFFGWILFSVIGHLMGCAVESNS